MIEKLIAYHCAPALAGIKPANLVSCSKEKLPDIYGDIERLNKIFNKKDIYLEIICDCKKCAVLMVYRKSVLEKHLNLSANRRFLAKYGYAESDETEKYISVLKRHFANTGFPHEIGVFLGYPLHDIYCFINRPDKKCLLVGEWKVYYNPQKAAETFHRYRICRNSVLKKISGGKTLAQIFCAA